MGTFHTFADSHSDVQWKLKKYRYSRIVFTFSYGRDSLTDIKNVYFPT